MAGSLPLTFAALFGLAATASASTAGLRRFGAWIAACDNVLTCRAIGLPRAMKGRKSGHLVIERAGGPAGAMALSWGAEGGAFTEILVDGDRAVAFPLTALADLPRRDDESESRHGLVDSATILRFVARAVQGDTIALDPNAAEDQQVPAEGMADALRWIDERQGRAGTSTAFVIRGSAAPAVVPKPPQPPLLPVSAGEPRVDPPRTLLAAARAHHRSGACKSAADSADEDIWGRTVGPRHWLFEVACRRADAVDIALYLGVSGGRPTIVDAPFERLDRTTGLLSIRPGNAPRRGGPGVGHGVVEEYAKGDEGCIDVSEWRWDGRAFRLASLVVRPVCIGGLAVGEAFALWRTRPK